MLTFTRETFSRACLGAVALSPGRTLAHGQEVLPGLYFWAIAYIVLAIPVALLLRQLTTNGRVRLLAITIGSVVVSLALGFFLPYRAHEAVINAVTYGMPSFAWTWFFVELGLNRLRNPSRNERGK